MGRSISVGSGRPVQEQTGCPEPEWHRFAKTKEVDALQIFEDFVVVGEDGGEMEGKAGDYLVWDGPKRCWPVPRTVFEAEHRRVA